jgi:ABC-type sugar transport system permease subunit
MSSAAAGMVRAPAHARHAGGPAAGSGIRGRVTPRRRREIRLAYVLLLPAVLLVAGIIGYPAAWELWLSLTNAATLRPAAAFVGLQNYISLLRAPEFWREAVYTLGFILATSVLKLAVGIAAALLLARPVRTRYLAFLAIFIPWVYPTTFAAEGWYWFMLPPVPASYGVFMSHQMLFWNRLLGDGGWGFLSLVVFEVWRGGSFIGILLFAAMSGIPQELFDYASLEVRSAWRKFWFVTAPLLRPFMALAVFLSLVTSIADLGDVWLLTGHRALFPMVWTDALQRALVYGWWGQASAEVLILLPVLALILAVCFRILEPLEEDPA